MSTIQDQRDDRTFAIIEKLVEAIERQGQQIHDLAVALNSLTKIVEARS